MTVDLPHIDENVVRHPNGHLMVERHEHYTPSRENTAQWLRSVAKAYPYLVDHANHIDGEFDNAHEDLKRGVEALHDQLDRMRASVATLTARIAEAERGTPDANCVTRADGECVSEADCMHGPGHASAVGAALLAALRTVGIGDDLRIYDLGKQAYWCVYVASDDEDVEPENEATCALEAALRASRSTGDSTPAQETSDAQVAETPASDDDAGKA